MKCLRHTGGGRPPAWALMGCRMRIFFTWRPATPLPAPGRSGTRAGGLEPVSPNMARGSPKPAAARAGLGGQGHERLPSGCAGSALVLKATAQMLATRRAGT
jgi:hypothetical protein